MLSLEYDEVTKGWRVKRLGECKSWRWAWPLPKLKGLDDTRNEETELGGRPWVCRVQKAKEERPEIRVKCCWVGVGKTRLEWSMRKFWVFLIEVSVEWEQGKEYSRGNSDWRCCGGLWWRVKGRVALLLGSCLTPLQCWGNLTPLHLEHMIIESILQSHNFILAKHCLIFIPSNSQNTQNHLKIKICEHVSKGWELHLGGASLSESLLIRSVFYKVDQGFKLILQFFVCKYRLAYSTVSPKA